MNTADLSKLVRQAGRERLSFTSIHREALGSHVTFREPISRNRASAKPLRDAEVQSGTGSSKIRQSLLF